MCHRHDLLFLREVERIEQQRGDLRAGDIPPTFYTYGTEDPFYRQFIANANAARQAGVQVEEHVLEGWPHGFGVRGEWTMWFDNFLTQIISQQI